MYLSRFYLSGKWSMANWAVAFTCSALAMCVILHHFYCGPDATVSRVMAYIAMCIASYANAVCLGHFVRDTFMFKAFTAEKEVTPLAIMKLTHEAIRCAPLLRMDLNTQARLFSVWT